MTTPKAAAGPMLQSFGCYLPHPPEAGTVVAPAYDSLTAEQRDHLSEQNPLSFLNLVRSEIDYPGQTDEERHAMLVEASDRLHSLLGGLFDNHQGPLFLVVRLMERGHTQTGLVAALSLPHYDAGHVIPHEETRRGQEDRLVEYMEAVQATFLPVFLTCKRSDAVTEMLDEVTAKVPLIDFQSADGLRQVIWVITDPDRVARAQAAADSIDSLYVADGHHRLAAASRYAAKRRAADPDSDGSEPYNSQLAVVFGDDQLAIHSYNRVASGVGDRSQSEFVRDVGAAGFAVERMPAWCAADATPARSGELSMFVGTEWYRLVAADIPEEPVGALDVMLLHDRIIGPLLGITDSRTDPRIEFVAGTLGLEEIERLTEDDYEVGFALHPTGIAELMAVSDLGEMMPPKSTWFAPKLRSGLIVSLLD